jgi:hypothetical protein
MFSCFYNVVSTIRRTGRILRYSSEKDGSRATALFNSSIAGSTAPTPTGLAEIIGDYFPVLARNNSGDNVYHCRECVSLGKLIYCASSLERNSLNDCGELGITQDRNGTNPTAISDW